MLAPIREHVNLHKPAEPQEIIDLTNAVISKTQELCKTIGSDGGLLAVLEIRRIIANIEASIRFGLKGSDWTKAAEAAQKYTAAITMAGIGNSQVLDEAFDKAKRDLPWTVEKLRVIWPDYPQHRRRGIFVEPTTKTISSSVGAAYSDDVAPTELCSFLNRQATKMSALTGFSQKGESSAGSLKTHAPGFAGRAFIFRRVKFLGKANGASGLPP